MCQVQPGLAGAGRGVPATSALARGVPLPRERAPPDHPLWSLAAFMSRMSTMPMPVPVRLLLLLPLVWLLLALPRAGAAEAGPATGAADAPGQPFISDADWHRTRAAPAAGGGTAPPPAGRAVAAMAVSLAVVLALAVGSVFLLRRFARRRGGPASGRHLELVETVHLGVKRSVAVLRLGDHVVLVGQSEQGLSGLGTFPASALAAPPAADPAPVVAVAAAPPSPSPFAAVLDRLTGKRR